MIDSTTAAATKPDHLTALRGNQLVSKGHPIIRLRGQIDSLEAQILSAQIVFQRLNLTQGTQDLNELLHFLKSIMRAEVLEKPLEPLNLLGLDEAELRHRSHHPKLTYGIGHFEPSVTDGEAVITLNALRTKTREVELAALDAFQTENGVTRPDLLQALNRLSSALYIMMVTHHAEDALHGKSPS